MLRDLRDALRTLRRAPVFTCTAVLALALGIGANAAVFSVVHAVLLKPLPYPDPDRLVRLWETSPAQGIERSDVSPGTFVDWRTRSRTLETVGVYMAARDWLLGFGGEPEVVRGSLATPSVFRVLGVRPVAGRLFRPEEEQSPPFGDQGEVLIGHGFWQRRFGGQEDVLGKVITLEGRVPLTIVGVMPPDFDFPGNVEAWRSESFLRPIGPAQRATRYYESIARLHAGATIDTAQAELAGIAEQLASEHPSSNAGIGVHVDRLDRSITGNVRPALLMLLGVVGCVLLIGCANVATLAIARATGRRHETAVRLALGAGTRRIAQQGLAEAGVLAALGGAAGLLLGYWGTRLLVALAPGDIPRLDEIAFAGPVLLFTACASMLAALVTGLVPALQARRVDVQDALKANARTAAADGGARRWLIGAQVALTLVPLIGATLLLRSFVQLRQVDVGFTSTGVLTGELRYPTNRFPGTRRPWFLLGQHYDRLLSELRGLPGVESVAGITGMPLTGEGTTGTFWMDDGTGNRPDATSQYRAGVSIVTPEYFATMGIPLVGGRGLASGDRLSEGALSNPQDRAAARPAGVLVVNQAFARRFFPGRGPVGVRIKLYDHWAVSASTIVGVVGDVRAEGVAQAAEPSIYVPWGEIPGFRLALAIRSNRDPASLIADVRTRVAAVDSALLVARLRPMGEVMRRAMSRPLFHLVLVGCFALLALALAVVGVYGVVAYLVTERTRELGIRMALGAQPADVVRLVLTEGLRPVLLGAAAGLGLAAVAARGMQTLLFGIASLDVVSFAAAGGTLVLASIIATLLPAARATKVDPIAALRDS